MFNLNRFEPASPTKIAILPDSSTSSSSALRFEMENSFSFLNANSAEQRNLSCCLNISWPSTTLDEIGLSTVDSEEILASLCASFSKLQKRRKSGETRATVPRNHFDGWASYPTATEAYEAFQVFRKELLSHALGARQWSRDIVLPKDWPKSAMPLVCSFVEQFRNTSIPWAMSRIRLLWSPDSRSITSRGPYNQPWKEPRPRAGYSLRLRRAELLYPSPP